MGTDPLGATAAATKLGDTVKGWPLWLFLAIALGLTVFVVVPPFIALAPGSYRAAVSFAAVMAWILAAAKGASYVPGLLATRRAYRAAQVKFVVTPVEDQSIWGIAKQQDGAYVTQITVRCMVKNRTAASHEGKSPSAQDRW